MHVSILCLYDPGQLGAVTPAEWETRLDAALRCRWPRSEHNLEQGPTVKAHLCSVVIDGELDEEASEEAEEIAAELLDWLNTNRMKAAAANPLDPPF